MNQVELNSSLEPVDQLKLRLAEKLRTCLKEGESTLQNLDDKAWGTRCTLLIRNNRLRYILATLDKNNYAEEQILDLVSEYNV